MWADQELSLAVMRSASPGLMGRQCAPDRSDSRFIDGPVRLLTTAHERQAHPVVKLRRADAAHMAAKVATSVGRALATPLGIAMRGSLFTPAAMPDQPELDSRCARPSMHAEARQRL